MVVYKALTLETAISEAEIQRLLVGLLDEDSTLEPLNGFSLNLSGNSGFRKVFFSAGCSCGTVAILSVEVAKQKNLQEVKRALPLMVESLKRQEKSFRSVSCELHTRMRVGRITGE